MSMSPELEPNINPIIWAAIEQKRLLPFRYKNRERIVEPHDYGIHNGVIKLFGYRQPMPAADAGGAPVTTAARPLETPVTNLLPAKDLPPLHGEIPAQRQGKLRYRFPG